jgi:predicted transcriptional regulator
MVPCTTKGEAAMSRAIAPKITQIGIRVPDDLLAQIDELTTPMQRPRSFVVIEALRDFIAAELEDARIVAHEVADIEANPDAGCRKRMCLTG